MDRLRPFVALTLLVAVATLLLPPGVVCAAWVDPASETVCPMAALMESEAPAASPCDGAAMREATRCCCAMRERSPVPLPVVPAVVTVDASNLSMLEAPSVATSAIAAPARPQGCRMATHVLPFHPSIDLFLKNSTYLI